MSVVHYFVMVPLDAALGFATLLGWLDSSFFGEIGCIPTVCFALVGMAETCGASSFSCLDRMQKDSFISALYFLVTYYVWRWITAFEIGV